DVYGNTITDYTGTVHFSSSDAQATLPFDFTFTIADQGVHTFNAILRTAGDQALLVSDVDNDGITTCNGVHVTAGPLDHFGFSTPANAVAGQPFSMVVSAMDAYGNALTDYTGTVHFSSSDDQATLPFDFTFTIADQGVHTFNAILRTAGTQSIVVSDGSDPSIATCNGIEVSPGAMHHFGISAPASAVAGEGF